MASTLDLLFTRLVPMDVWSESNICIEGLRFSYS